MQENGRGSYNGSANQRGRSTGEWETYDPEEERRERQKEYQSGTEDCVEGEARSREPENMEEGETYDPEEEMGERQEGYQPGTEDCGEGEARSREPGNTEEGETYGPEEVGERQEVISVQQDAEEKENAPALLPEASAAGQTVWEEASMEESVPKEIAETSTEPEEEGEKGEEMSGEPEDGAEETEKAPKSEELPRERAVPDSEIAEYLMQLNQRLEQLDRKFDQKIRTSESQDIMAKTLYAEVQEYKKGMYSDILKPLLLELVQMRNNIVRQCRGIMEKEGKEAMISVQKLLDYGEDIRDVLEAYDVEIFQAEPGSEFDPRNQKLLKKVPVTREAMNKTIAVSLCDGYKYRDRTIVKENVKVYVYDPENENRQ